MREALSIASAIPNELSELAVFGAEEADYYLLLRNYEDGLRTIEAGIRYREA